jgi:thymidylate synthase ThyX
MEGASLFATARIMRRSAASVVVGSDRYVFKDGKLSHQYGDIDEAAAKRVALRAALGALRGAGRLQ